MTITKTTLINLSGKFHTMAELASHLGISERTLYRLRSEFGIEQSLVESRKRLSKKRVCENCGGDRPYHNARFCSIKCDSEFKKNERIRQWLSGEIPIHGTNKELTPMGTLRDYLYKKNQYRCEECGFEGYNKKTGNSILQIHHIDGNASNGSPNNIQVLCPNCHAMTETFMANNKGNSARRDRYD